MRREAAITAQEAALLQGLIGVAVHAVLQDGWSVVLRTELGDVLVEPDEVPMPDVERPFADVSRISIRARGPGDEAGGDVICGDAGRVVAASVIVACVEFGPVTRFPPGELLGVSLPASRGYDQSFVPMAELSPGDPAAAARSSIVAVDVGLELVTERSPSLTFFTTGFFVRTSIGGLPPDEGWAQPAMFARRLIGRAARA
jgi:hypothetical protein